MESGIRTVLTTIYNRLLELNYYLLSKHALLSDTGNWIELKPPKPRLANKFGPPYNKYA